MGCESGRKRAFGQPDESMRIGGELWRHRMRRCAIEYISNGLTSTGRERGDVDERLYFLGVRLGDDRAGVGVRGENDRTTNAIDGAFERRHIIGERGEGQRRSE